MSSLASEYCDQLKNNFKVLFAAFPPNIPVALGDFGVLDDATFVRLGNIQTHFGVDPLLLKSVSGSPSDFEFTSEGSVDVEFRAKGDATPSGVPVKAGLDISFSRQYSVFFSAAHCVPAVIEDQLGLAAKIMELYRADQRWQKKFVLVTTVMQAGNATIAVSSSSSANLSLDASSDKIATIDLADVGLSLTVKRLSSIGFKAVTQSGLTPLLGLSKIQGGFFTDEEVGPLSMPAAIANRKTPATEPPLFFAAMLG